MGLKINNFQDERGFTSNKYVKIDSLHNMGEVQRGQIVLNCTEWFDTDARTRELPPVASNKVYIIKDGLITNANSLIEACYPLFKQHLLSLGLDVEDDMNNYQDEINAKKEEELQQIESEATEEPQTVKRLK